jgi:C1A family cysteine protease
MFFLVFFLFIFPLPAHGGEDQRLISIREAIKEKGASWVAEENAISQMRDTQWKGLFGAREEATPHGRVLWTAPDKTGQEDLPSRFDWRSEGGGNWLSPVKMQYLPRYCGSCWAFAALGTLEAHIRIASNRPDLFLDLSEQFLLACSNGDCDGGYTSETLTFLEEMGTTDEICMPYEARDDIACEERCADWLVRRIRIGEWARMGDEGPYTLEDLKEQILQGPVIAWMKIYEDVLFYRSGIYEQTWGDDTGETHVVMMVGWDDEEGYWICQNSWSTLWGEAGYFRIRMGTNESGIETYHYTLRPQADSDEDGITDDTDNCLLWQNPEQADSDTDSWGEACDCDDTRSHVNPGMTEVSLNRIDDDCDGRIDEFCFIASAAFGTDLEPKLDTLRCFRDVYLINNSAGKAFLTTYYKCGAQIADYIAEHEWLRRSVRILLLPVIGLVSLFV